LENTQVRLQFGIPGSNSETRGSWSEGLGNNIVVQYYVGPIITIHGRITTREYVVRLGNQVQPMIQTIFPNNDAVFQDDNASIHTAGTVQSWFEEHEGELHLTWPAQSPDLNVPEPPWSVLETKMRNRFSPPTRLEHLEDVLQEDWNKIPLQIVQNLYQSIPRSIVAVWNAEDGPTPY
jgi:hypothetical protein